MQKIVWPKVTVVIVNWNGEHFLGRCLSALQELSVAPNEIIVVDNASMDGSLAILNRFPHVRLLAQEVNLGFARANNLAIKAADPTSEWIALINPDAFVDPFWLEALLIAARTFPAFSAFASKLLNAEDPTVLDGRGDALHVSGKVWRIGYGKHLPSKLETGHEVFSPCAAAALYLRSAIIEVDGFDEDFFCYVEDVDLGFRLRLAGYRCRYVPGSVVHHVGSATTGGHHSDFAVYHGHRNQVWMYVKNMPPLLFWAFLPLHLLMNICAILMGALRGQGCVLLRAKRDAVIALPKFWDKRKQVQCHRVVSWRAILKAMNKVYLKL